jgi:hypothetical protein
MIEVDKRQRMLSVVSPLVGVGLPQLVGNWLREGEQRWKWRLYVKVLVSDPRNASLMCWASLHRRNGGPG